MRADAPICPVRLVRVAHEYGLVLVQRVFVLCRGGSRQVDLSHIHRMESSRDKLRDESDQVFPDSFFLSLILLYICERKKLVMNLYLISFIF